jgi:HlyD family secretion protein
MRQTKQIFILIYFVIFIAACGNKNSSIQPELKNISESVYASGIIKSKDQYQVFSKVNGILKTVFVKEGDLVKKGQLLFQLNNDNAHLSTENARLAAKNADYTANLSKRKDLKNSIMLARKKLATDSLLLVRQNNLWGNNIGTKVDLEQKGLNVENSKTLLASAIFKYEDLQRQMTLADGQSENNLRISQTLENDLAIKSEVDGRVYSIYKEQSELVTTLAAIAVIGDDAQFLIELNIDEHDIVKLKIGQQVFVRMDSYKGEVFEGVVSSIEPMMNERTRSFLAEATFVKKPKTLYPNLTVEANIVISTKQKALTIPRNYLINDSTVMLKDGKLQKVQTGLMDYALVEITEGISKDTKIILAKK